MCFLNFIFGFFITSVRKYNWFYILIYSVAVLNSFISEFLSIFYIQVYAICETWDFNSHGVLDNMGSVSVIALLSWSNWFTFMRIIFSVCKMTIISLKSIVAMRNTCADTGQITIISII